MEDKDSVNSLVVMSELDNLPSSASILDLNNDCLILIFQQLNILDRLRLERVCKRWQVLLKKSWHNFHALRFYNDDWGFKDPRDLDDLNTRKFKKILRRCGKFVKNIELNYSSKNLGPNVFSTISKYCPNIENIEIIGDTEFCPEGIRALAERCSQLVHISLGNFTKNCDEELALLFWRNRKLRFVHFSRDSNITGKCLSALNADKIESIFFDNCIGLSIKYLVALQKLKNLKKLELNYLFVNNIEAAVDISECFYNLIKLTMTFCTIFPSPLGQIAKLHNIQELSVSRNYSIRDDALVAIGNYCKSLEMINISHCILITTRGLAAILALPNLKILFATHLNCVNDDVFNCTHKLEVLDCSNCANITNDGMTTIIKNSHKLQSLMLWDCEKISNGLIIGAIRYSKMRENNVVLKIHLSEGQVNLDEITDSSPLLQVGVSRRTF